MHFTLRSLASVSASALTFETPHALRLRPYRADPVYRPDTALLRLPGSDEAWLWRANHSDGDEPITGGLAQTRELVHSIDGDHWPWTVISAGSTGVWFQVLGTPDVCVLELGMPGRTRMVARSGAPQSRLRALPEACQYWTRSCRAEEQFSATEACTVGIDHLRGRPLPPGLHLRPVYLTTLDSRTP